MTQTLRQKLAYIQQELKAPKAQKNSFGNYNYRSCEDILEAVKPLLKETKTLITIGDKIIMVGDRYYVKANVEIKDLESDNKIFTNAYAREEETKKGMDGAQITGSASSYARKYALNGLLAIDDTKDSDTTNTHGKVKEVVIEDYPRENAPQGVKTASPKQVKFINTLISNLGKDRDKVKEYYKVKSLNDLTISQASELIEVLQNQATSIH